MYFSILKAMTRYWLGLEPHPGFVTFFVTWRCNCKCQFCEIWKRDESDLQNELTLDEIESIFRSQKQIDVLRLSGGEPFLRKDLAEIINRIDKVCRVGMVHITTNGLLTDRIAGTLRAINRQSSIHIKISLDDTGTQHDKVRGIPGAFTKVMQTIQTLLPLREEMQFHLGVNQVIVDEANSAAYDRVKEALQPFSIPVYPVIAHKGDNALYATENVTADPTYRTYGQFSPEALEDLLKRFRQDSQSIGSFSERIVDRYYLRGLYNRLVSGNNKPRPACQALANHLRILPNGDVPVCFFNSTIVGNLRDTPFITLWRSEATLKARKWVRRCPGCWESCEVIPSAAYTGDLVKGLWQ